MELLDTIKSGAPIPDETPLTVTDVKQFLHENGFEYNAVIRKWAEKGYVDINSEGKYTHKIRMLGSVPRCIKLNINLFRELGIEVNEEPPEEFTQEQMRFECTT